MPISTSVITGTVAHKHSLASAEGGYLAEGTTGITGGNIGEVLTATATDVPQWASVVASGGNLEYVGTTTALTTAPNGYNGLHLTFSAIDLTTVTELMVVVAANRGVNSLGFLFNGVTSGYAYGGYVYGGGSGSGFGNASGSHLEIGHWQVGTVQTGTVHLTLNENDDKINLYGVMGGNSGGSFAGGTTGTVSTTIDSVSFIESNQNMPAGNNRLTVYKVVR